VLAWLTLGDGVWIPNGGCNDMQVIETSMEMDKLIVYLPTYKNGSNESTHKCSAS